MWYFIRLIRYIHTHMVNHKAAGNYSLLYLKGCIFPTLASDKDDLIVLPNHHNRNCIEICFYLPVLNSYLASRIILKNKKVDHFNAFLEVL